MVVYDPAQQEKLAFKRIVRGAILEVGAMFPLFKNDVKLKVTVTFRVTDMQIDIDNLLKFLLDALTTVMYNNNNMINLVVATKIMATRGFKCTEFMVKTSSRARVEGVYSQHKIANESNDSKLNSLV
jgi:Holliday junction resolvase RusA-like endonuclease